MTLSTAAFRQQTLLNPVLFSWEQLYIVPFSWQTQIGGVGWCKQTELQMNPTHLTEIKDSLTEKKINNKGVNFITEFFFSSVTYHCNLISEYSPYILLSYPSFRHTRTITIVYKKTEQIWIFSSFLQPAGQPGVCLPLHCPCTVTYKNKHIYALI